MNSTPATRPPPFWIWPAASLAAAGLFAGAVWMTLVNRSKTDVSQTPPPATATATATGDAALTPATGESTGGLIATLPTERHVPDFAFTERSGKTVRRADLLGKIWVADFIFTHCAGTCPVMTSSLRTVQERCKDLPDLRLVSFTVDPERDTVQVLKDFASSQGADPERWLYLTGDKAALYDFINKGFLLPVGASPNDPATPGIEAIMHSPRFVLVDATGKLVAMYTGTEAASVEKLIADLHTMAAQAAR
ncbi:MAG TPA: SCO family protein [Planctomycetota bacterium]|nr:SCO family protein [Planctomycetota bacterium]